MRCVLALAIGLLFAARIAHAEVHVVLAQTRNAPSLPGLSVQVQLHAGRPVSISAHAAPDEDARTFAGHAAQIVDARDATVVVWIESAGGDDGTRTLLVYAAGRWPDRALIELVRLDAAIPPAEVERTVALKIAGLLETVTSPRPIAAALGVTAPPLEPRWRIELAGAVVRERGDRRFDPRIAAAADRRIALDGWGLAVGLGAHWQPSGRITGEDSLVTIDELGATLAIAAELRLGAWHLFARPHVSAAILLADGSSTRPRGTSGSATVISPTAGGQVGARWPLSDRLELGVAVGIDAALTRQQFLVDGEVAADLRRVRGVAGLALSVPLP